MPDFISIENHLGQPVRAHGVRLFPFAQTLTLRFPNLNLGFVWNRPTSVLVMGADGHEQVLPIRDPTRQIIWMLFGGLTVLTGLMIWSTFVQRGINERRERT